MKTNVVPRCWMCGDLATSREHRFKRSDLVRRHGRDFKNTGGILHFIDGKNTREVQGPNARRLTYKPILCEACNSARSQPWDRAYEAFETWIFANQSEVLRRRSILFSAVFGEDCGDRCVDLYKYFVKAFGCKLVDGGERVPRHLVKLLNRKCFRTRLRLVFSVNKTMFAFDKDVRQNYLGVGELIREDSRSRGMMQRYVWHLQVGWLRIWFFYNNHIPAGLGAPWTADAACLYLGEFEPATLDELINSAERDRAEILAEWKALREAGGIRVEV